MDIAKRKKETRRRRHTKVRSMIHGTVKRPRLSVFRSNRQIQAQLIDDESGNTIASASSLTVSGDTQKERATEVGKAIAKVAKAKKIDKVVFDRGGFLYAGSVRRVADGAREGGLVF